MRMEYAVHQSFGGFRDELLKGYLETIHGERNAIFKMKEIWGYYQYSFKENKSALIEIRKNG